MIVLRNIAVVLAFYFKVNMQDTNTNPTNAVDQVGTEVDQASLHIFLCVH